MWRIGPNASASIASTRARIRAWKAGRSGDALRRALAALGAVLGGAALGRVDDRAGEQRVAGGGEAAGRGQRFEGGEQGRVEMGLGEVEMEAGQVEREAREAVGLGGEEVGQGATLDRLDGGPGLVLVHAAALSGGGGRCLAFPSASSDRPGDMVAPLFCHERTW